jgi:hypothetical protein
MKTVALVLALTIALGLALGLLLATSPFANAKCFLFFCPPPVHHKVVRHHTAPAGPRGAGFCEKVTLDFAAGDKSKDEFVRAFPTNEQRRVLLCFEGSNSR